MPNLPLGRFVLGLRSRKIGDRPAGRRAWARLGMECSHLCCVVPRMTIRSPLSIRNRSCRFASSLCFSRKSRLPPRLSDAMFGSGPAARLSAVRGHAYELLVPEGMLRDVKYCTLRLSPCPTYQLPQLRDTAEQAARAAP